MKIFCFLVATSVVLALIPSAFAWFGFSSGPHTFLNSIDESKAKGHLSRLSEVVQCLRYYLDRAIDNYPSKPVRKNAKAEWNDKLPKIYGILDEYNNYKKQNDPKGMKAKLAEMDITFDEVWVNMAGGMNIFVAGMKYEDRISKDTYLWSCAEPKKTQSFLQGLRQLAARSIGLHWTTKVYASKNTISICNLL